jgi:drug/metabolite transporter (DMT)-like permease
MVEETSYGKRVALVQVIAVVIFATLCVSAGETLLRAGMKLVGEGNHGGFEFVLAAISTPQVLIGTALMMVYFALYSLALSWADISFVLPITALSYLFVAGLARFFLHENVTPARWIGAVIITLGVIVVAVGGGEHK